MFFLSLFADGFVTLFADVFHDDIFVFKTLFAIFCVTLLISLTMVFVWLHMLLILLTLCSETCSREEFLNQAWNL